MGVLVLTISDNFNFDRFTLGAFKRAPIVVWHIWHDLEEPHARAAFCACQQVKRFRDWNKFGFTQYGPQRLVAYTP
jgi:hypothetical protein